MAIRTTQIEITFPQFHQAVTRRDDPAFLGLVLGRVVAEGRPDSILVAVRDPGRQPVRPGSNVAVPLALLRPA